MNNIVSRHDLWTSHSFHINTICDVFLFQSNHQGVNIVCKLVGNSNGSFIRIEKKLKTIIFWGTLALAIIMVFETQQGFLRHITRALLSTDFISL